jgi:predicted regulator of Ras-like GTPase activity (Roadblock/LC7/MglB family)
MFLDKLSRIGNRIPGARALCLIDGDGIPVDSVSSAGDVDLDLLAAELINQMQAIADDHQDLDMGAVQQLTVNTERLTLMVSSVGFGYYLLLALEPDANQGRARFELRRARLQLAEDLDV